jgi:hypothetical protein
LCVSFKIDDHGGRQGNTAQALNQWWHPVASSEAPDVLQQAMRFALHPCIRMAIEITSNLPAFFVVTNYDYLFAHNLH